MGRRMVRGNRGAVEHPVAQGHGAFSGREAGRDLHRSVIGKRALDQTAVNRIKDAAPARLRLGGLLRGERGIHGHLGRQLDQGVAPCLAVFLPLSVRGLAEGDGSNAERAEGVLPARGNHERLAVITEGKAFRILPGAHLRPGFLGVLVKADLDGQQEVDIAEELILVGDAGDLVSDCASRSR